MAVIIRQQSRSSVTSDMGLPPIIEAPAKSSATSSKTFKTRDYENLFRRNSRRSSVSSSVTSASDSGISSRDTSVTTSPRRVSASEKRNSIDLTKSEKIMKKVDQQRRMSVQKMNDRKLSFGSVGKSVTALLKAKNAFARLRKNKNKQKTFEEEQFENEKAFEIDNLPHKPRFASTLSAEAQYAVMKGYEDVVYSNLCNQYPEYRPMLRRNRTPITGITVSVVKGNQDKITKIPRSSKERKQSNDTVDGSVDDTTDSRDDIGPATTSTPKPEEMSKTSPREAMNPSPVSVLNSTADRSPRDILTGSPFTKSKRRANHSRRKASSFPEIPNKEKQLVMTYRYQRAMDILDNLRENQGLHALSPRVKGDCNIEPLKDYNSWSFVWTREFEPKKANKNMAKNINS